MLWSTQCSFIRPKGHAGRLDVICWLFVVQLLQQMYDSVAQENLDSNHCCLLCFNAIVHVEIDPSWCLQCTTERTLPSIPLLVWNDSNRFLLVFVV